MSSTKVSNGELGCVTILFGIREGVRWGASARGRLVTVHESQHKHSPNEVALPLAERRKVDGEATPSAELGVDLSCRLAALRHRGPFDEPRTHANLQEERAIT